MAPLSGWLASTSGLALSLGDFPLAIGALLLFGINMVTIILASMISLWMVGIRNLKKASGWIVAVGSVVIVAVVALSRVACGPTPITTSSGCSFAWA